jgi:hypothetical protein
VRRTLPPAEGANNFAGGSGVYIEDGSTFLHGTIVAANTAPTNGPNCLGFFTSEAKTSSRTSADA